MKVGIDVFSIRDLKLDDFKKLDWIKENGFAGAQFGCMGVDVKLMKEVRSHADSLELYSHTSVSSPNHHYGESTFAERKKQIVAEVEAAAEVGWHELHSTLGSDSNRYHHPSTSWTKQLTDSVLMLRELAPVLRTNQARINLEPHGDTSTFELVRIVEKVGPDVCGVCLDTANVLVYAEHPVEAAKRVAPYTHLTHTKDAFPYLGEKGLMRQTTAPGQGAIDWEAVLPILGEYSPDLPLSIEDHKWLFCAEIFEPSWHEEQADLSRRELAMTVQLAWREQQKIISGERTDPEEYEKIPYVDELEKRLYFGRDYLNGLLEKLNLKS